MRPLRLSFLAALGAIAVLAACDAFSSDDSPAPATGLDASTPDASTPDAPSSGSDAGADSAREPTTSCGKPVSSGLFFCDDFEDPDASRTPFVALGSAAVTGGVLVSDLTSTDGGALAAMRYTFQLSVPWTKVRISSDVTLLDLGSTSDASTDPNLSVGVIQLRDSTDYTVSVMAVGPTANIWVFGSTKDDLVKVAYTSTERLVRGVSRHMNLRIGYKPLVISLELDGKSVDLQSVGGALPSLESTTQVDALIGAVTVASNTTAKVRQDNLEIETRP